MVASVGFMDGRLPFVGMRLKCNYLCVSYIVEVFLFGLSNYWYLWLICKGNRNDKNDMCKNQR